ncbi:uridine kinase family protein [Crossiella cryophila]|uniref:Energy-coupling factor transporter ATP-binding protein EcfA2 n=1 Tax=Crossiella cryophila TaxID=43355 RepID=A0A7W7FQP8_9PSEU|nr:(d)CMP kinase [Crossiella cryophila]MBB4675186.1 energy-coupling factor transporter ATP-binding protein EcfA2 [Crossiella cryophila]
MHGAEIEQAAGLLLAAPPRLGAVRLLAVDGPSGSGKSTLADALATELRGRGHHTALVRSDEFATWDDPVSWWPRLTEGVLEPLRRAESGRYQRTAWTGGLPHPGDWITLPVPEILLLEGVSTGRRSLTPLLSALVWVELADPGRRLERAVTRDGDMCRNPLLRWQRFERGWFGVDDTRERADLRVNADGHRKIG